METTPISENDNLMKPSRIAVLLGVHPATIRNWARSGKIPVAYQLGTTMRLRLDDVLEALEKSTKSAVSGRRAGNGPVSGQETGESAGS